MAWEKMGVFYKKCVCKADGITYESYMDDWNRNETEVFINCENCKSEYRLIKEANWAGKHGYMSEYYLFPKKINLPKANILIINQPKIESICNKYSLKNLNELYQLIKNETNSQKILNIKWKKFIKYYNSNYHTKKIKIIKEDLKEAIENYKNFNTNFEIENKKYLEKLKIRNEIWEKWAIKI